MPLVGAVTVRAEHSVEDRARSPLVVHPAPPPPTGRADGRPRPPAVAWAALFVLLGLGLRFRDVTSPLIGPDEVHAPRVATSHDYGEIFSFYSSTDHSLPYTLYARLLMDLDALTAVRYRLPSMVCAVLLLLSPLLLRRRLGTPTTLVAVALLACDPLAVYFAMVARPYAAASLCLVLATHGWLAWLDRDDARGGWGFPVWGALAVLFHAFCGVAVAVLGLYGVLRERGGRRRWGPLVVRGLALAALVALPRLPGLEALLETRLEKVAEGALEAGFLRDVWITLTARSAPLVWGLPVLLLVGAVAARRARERLAGLATVLVVVQAAVVLLVRPYGPPAAWARYLHLVWPFALVVAARGLVALVGSLGVRVAAPAAALLLLAAVPATSPVPWLEPAPQPYRCDDLHILMNPVELPVVPGTYRRILGSPDPGTAVVECPGVRNIVAWHVPVALQELHGLPVVVGVEWIDELRAQGIHYRNYVDPRSREELDATGARFLVLYPEKVDTPLGDLLRRRYEHAPVDDLGFQLVDLGRPTGR